MKGQKAARIVGMGSYVPEKILTNADLEKMVDTNDEWIVSRTGIKERRIAAEGECSSHMGTQAAMRAFENCSVRKDQIDMLIVATMTPDFVAPSTASLIQAQLGIPAVPTMDVQAACTGFIYALSMAKAYVESGMYSHVLVIASEKMSTVVDYTDRNTCVLFGDGASAAIVTNYGKGLSVNAVTMGTEGALAEIVYVPGGGSRIPASIKSLEEKQHYIVLNGREVFKNAVRRMAASAEECLKAEGLSQEDLTWMIPHQANERIIDAIAKNLEFPQEKIYKTVHKYGNTSAASVPLALDELIRNEALKKGDRLLLVAFGAGLTWGSVILTVVEE